MLFAVVLVVFVVDANAVVGVFDHFLCFAVAAVAVPAADVAIASAITAAQLTP